MVERSQKEVWRTTPWLMIALLLGSFILMAWDAKTGADQQRILRVWSLALADFVQSPMTSASSGVNTYFQSFANIRNAASENDELKQKIQQLQVEVQSREDLATENDRLKTLLNLKETTKYPVLTAKIIGRDPSGWFNDSVINQGSLNGVKLNMPVVANGGLVGRITAVSPLTAQVTLVTDERFGAGAVAGEIETSSAIGVVSGMDDRELLEMRHVPGSVDVQTGQSVFTTGQDGIYPAGIKLGEIVEVSGGSATASKTIYIKPSAGLNSMQEVAVLLYEAPLRQKFEQSLPNAVKDNNTKPKRPAR